MNKETFVLRDFIDTLRQWRISFSLDENYRVQLTGGNSKAREHFSKVIKKYPLIESLLILKLAENDEDLRIFIEERAAVLEFNYGGSGNLLNAIQVSIITG